MKVGLLLEGGGMRGLYTCGVLDTFMEENINVDGIIGVSAGSLFGVNYFSNQKKRALNYNLKYARSPRYISPVSLVLTGNIVNKKFAYYKISYKLFPFDNETFIKSNKDFYATVTNVETGKAEYIKLENPLEQMEVIRATSSLPLASKIVEIDGKKYLDGGIADSIPIDKMLSLGYDKVIVVLTQPLDYRKDQLSSKMLKRIEKKFKEYPNLVKTMEKRYKKYNKCLDKIKKLEKEGKVFVIRPSSRINIDLVRKNKKKLQNAYDMGVEDTKKVLNDLNEYLKK